MSILPLYLHLYLLYFFIGFVVVSNIYAIAQLPLSLRDSTSIYQALHQKLAQYFRKGHAHSWKYSFLK
ncbi:MAG: hypothetical protein VX278_08585 [Myxococcota bacterium]|nr:hypothetical protein [Myxococcota bacterium]